MFILAKFIKIIHITESELRETVQAVLRQEAPSMIALNKPIPQRKSLNEMARVNVRDNGKLFPFNAYKVEVYGKEHNPPHMHVISLQEGYDIRISIDTGDLVSVKSYGNRSEGNLFKDVVKKAKKWLQQANNMPGSTGNTNQQVATMMWYSMNTLG